MPIFKDSDSEEGTFGPSMSAAMSLHRAKKDKGEDGDKKSKKEHLDKAKEHIDAAMDEHDEHEDEDMPGMGMGLSSLGEGGEE